MSNFLRWMARLSVSLTGFAILAGSLIIGGCSRSSAPAGPRFAFVTNGVASFWSIAAAGSRQAAKDLGVEVTVVMPDGLTDQTRKLEDLISRGIDGVAVEPH